MAVFRDRSEAGDRLADRLAGEGYADPIVLALPRGGVPVAARVAARLGVPVHVLVSRKLGVPFHRELGFGAISEGGALWIDRGTVGLLGLRGEDVEAVVSREAEEVKRRVAAYRGGAPLPKLAGRTVVLVDDGIATGGTMRAAIEAVQRHGPGRVIVAVPVAAAETARELRPLVDEMVCVEEPTTLMAIGLWYRHFPQLEDREVLRWLGGGEGEAARGPEA